MEVWPGEEQAVTYGVEHDEAQGDAQGGIHHREDHAASRLRGGVPVTWGGKG